MDGQSRPTCSGRLLRTISSDEFRGDRPGETHERWRTVENRTEGQPLTYSVTCITMPLWFSGALALSGFVPATNKEPDMHTIRTLVVGAPSGRRLRLRAQTGIAARPPTPWARRNSTRFSFPQRIQSRVRPGRRPWRTLAAIRREDL